MAIPQRWRTIPGSDQKIAAGAASVASAAVGGSTYAVMLSASVNVHIAIGVAPVASATTYLLKASDPSLQIGLSPGEKIAVIEDTTGGSLYIVELTS